MSSVIQEPRKKDDITKPSRFWNIVGVSSKVFGVVLISAGFYEFVTSWKISPLIPDFQTNLTDILNHLANNLDKMPVIVKFGTGLAGIEAGNILIEANGGPKKNSNSPR